MKKYEAEDEDMDLNEISDETMKDQPDGKKSKKNAKVCFKVERNAIIEM